MGSLRFVNDPRHIHMRVCVGRLAHFTLSSEMSMPDLSFELMLEEKIEQALSKALAKQGKPAKATKNSKKAKSSAKKAPTYPRVELPEGWKHIKGMEELKKSAYKASRDSELHGHEPWGFHNHAGYEAVRLELAK